MRSEPDTGKDMSPRLKRIIVLATLGAFLLSACAEASWVATVNDEPVEEESVLALRESYQAGESSVAGEPFRQDLTGLIVLEAQIQAAEEDFGLTGLDDAARRDDALVNVSPFDRADVERVTSDPDLTEESLEALGTQLAVRNAVLAVLAVAEPGFLEELWSNRPVQTTQVCVRHIIVATEDEIDAVAARIAAGEDFSAVADEVVADPTSPGGRLECPIPAAAFVPPFDQVAAATPVGEVSEPFQTEFGWHIILVDEIDVPASLEDLQADPLRFIFIRTLDPIWAAWVNDAVARADIGVRSQVGTWVSAVDGIAPPP